MDTHDTTVPVTAVADTGDPAGFWEALYQQRDGASGVNAALAEVASPLPPGAALDLGCGAGGDTLWLAEHGWTVTAIDISPTALRRLAERAERRGLGERVSVERHDLARSFPDGGFDLVSAQFLHSPFELPRAETFRRAAHALHPDGRLLIVDHGSIAPWSWNQDADTVFPSPIEVAAQMHLDPGRWLIERADTVTRDAVGPNGEHADVTDHVLVIRRRSR